jgi:hypothetical protein
MIIGAFIAFFAYIIGSIDSDIKAQDLSGQKKIITCDTLLVKESIAIGNNQKGYILLNTTDDTAAIYILDRNVAHIENAKSSLIIGVNKESAVINIKDSSGKNTLTTLGLQP